MEERKKRTNKKKKGRGERKKQGEGGQAYLYVHSVKTIGWFLYISVIKHCHLLCWVYKKIVIFSLFTLRFIIQNLSIRERLRGGWGNSLKLEGKEITYKMNRGEQGGSGSKIQSFKWTFSLNDTKVFLLQLRSMIC